MSQIKPMIENALKSAFRPKLLDVKDESYMHAAGADAQSHYKVTIVSDEFEGKRLIQRHRSVNRVLAEVLGQIHALALHTYTEKEWQAQGQAPDSPHCMGGGGSV